MCSSSILDSCFPFATTIFHRTKTNDRNILQFDNTEKRMEEEKLINLFHNECTGIGQIFIHHSLPFHPYLLSQLVPIVVWIVGFSGLKSFCVTFHFLESLSVCVVLVGNEILYGWLATAQCIAIYRTSSWKEKDQSMWSQKFTSFLFQFLYLLLQDLFGFCFWFT